MGALSYRVVERHYGPGVCAGDWQAEGLRPAFDAGALRLGTYGSGSVTRHDHPLPGGGDVELTVTFSLERLGVDGAVAVDFNRGDEQCPGFGVEMTRRLTRATHCGRVVHEGVPTERSWHGIHTVRLVTLGEEYELEINGEPLVAGRIDPPGTANEGRLALRIADADIRLLACEEHFVVHDVRFPTWERAELLYDEVFGPEAFRKNWAVCGARPDVMQHSITFNPMSVCVLRQRFPGPISVECVARPMPTKQFDAGVTDAIFIWMMDNPAGDLLEHMASMPNAELSHFLPLPFYWVDFGGTNNQTTRLRRNPHRRLIRQFDDRRRLLKRDQSYTITLAQVGSAVEFWVDGKQWIQAHDPAPLTDGHIGFRAFVAGLRISDLKIWRVVEK